MLDGREDQAAGLRRLFRRAPPQVVALYAGGRRAADNAALAAHRIAGRSERVLVLDEAEGDATLCGALGVGEGDTVAYLLPNCLETAAVLMGGAVAGIVNPINPLLEPEQIAAILRETKAKVLVTLKPFPKSEVAQKAAAAVAFVPEVKHVVEVDLLHYLSPPKSWIVPFLRPKVEVRHHARVHDFAAALAAQPGDRLTFDPGLADRVAALFHTGGTTGTPKMAQHRFGGMIYNGWLGQEFLFTERDVLICPLPLLKTTSLAKA